ncbi:hypothetical protein HWV62_7898 [Athelia sp. TMB]|nr:hypothetical protein HWV62_7898 [Athelia sp. TMB]
MLFFKILFRLACVSSYAYAVFLGLGAIYLALPSPPVDEATVLSNLNSGSQVARAYRVSHFIPDPPCAPCAGDAARFAQKWEHKDAFALKWSFDAATHTLRASGAPLFTFHPDRADERNVTVQPHAPVLAGELNGVALPWFSMADAVLLFEGVPAMHDPAHAALPLRAARTDSEGATTYAVSVAMPAFAAPALLTLTYPGPTLHLPPAPLSASPSRTFPVRRALVWALAPIATSPWLPVAARAITVGAQVLFWGSAAWVVWALLFGPLKGWRVELVANASEVVVKASEAVGENADGGEKMADV